MVVPLHWTLHWIHNWDDILNWISWVSNVCPSSQCWYHAGEAWQSNPCEIGTGNFGDAQRKWESSDRHWDFETTEQESSDWEGYRGGSSEQSGNNLPWSNHLVTTKLGENFTILHFLPITRFPPWQHELPTLKINNSTSYRWRTRNWYQKRQFSRLRLET